MSALWVVGRTRFVPATLMLDLRMVAASDVGSLLQLPVQASGHDRLPGTLPRPPAHGGPVEAGGAAPASTAPASVS